MRYLRVFNGDDGQTHMEDVAPAATTTDSPVSTARALLSERVPAESVLFRTVQVEHPAGMAHPAPRRQFVVHLAGTARIETSDGAARTVGPGDVVLVEDTAPSAGHVTTRLGDTERVTMFVTLPSEEAT